MSGRVGVDVGPTRIRGVVARPFGGVRTFEVPFDPARPEVAIASLRAEVAAPDAVMVSIGLGLLHVARVQLPASGDEARERMVQLEPERFFATEAPVHASLAPGSDVAFAIEGGWIDELRRALEEWGPVTRVEPAPLAIAACLARDSSGTFAVESASGESGTLELRDGRVTQVRRVSTAVAGARALPAVDAVGGDWLAALGAARREDAGVIGSLLTAEQRLSARRRTRRDIGIAALAAVAALAFMLGAASRWRERTLSALEAEADRLTSTAQPAIEAQGRLAARARERRLVRAELAGRPDVAGALAAIGQVLPHDVILLSARAAGGEWQIDGTARDAAGLVPLLEADERFDNVHSLSASTRFRDGGRTRETFSIALHVRPAS